MIQTHGIVNGFMCLICFVYSQRTFRLVTGMMSLTGE